MDYSQLTTSLLKKSLYSKQSLDFVKQTLENLPSKNVSTYLRYQWRQADSGAQKLLALLQKDLETASWSNKGSLSKIKNLAKSLKEPHQIEEFVKTYVRDIARSPQYEQLSKTARKALMTQQRSRPTLIPKKLTFEPEESSPMQVIKKDPIVKEESILEQIEDEFPQLEIAIEDLEESLPRSSVLAGYEEEAASSSLAVGTGMEVVEAANPLVAVGAMAGTTIASLITGAGAAAIATGVHDRGWEFTKDLKKKNSSKKKTSKDKGLQRAIPVMLKYVRDPRGIVRRADPVSLQPLYQHGMRPPRKPPSKKPKTPSKKSPHHHLHPENTQPEPIASHPHKNNTVTYSTSQTNKLRALAEYLWWEYQQTHKRLKRNKYFSNYTR
jgi:hypothetical protein